MDLDDLVEPDARGDPMSSLRWTLKSTRQLAKALRDMGHRVSRYEPGRTEMLVQRVVAPVSGAVSWTVVDNRFDPIEPAEAYLAHLDAIERSPNTVRAYASSLRLWFEHLAGRDVAWDGVGLDDVGRFVSWLRAPAEGVIVIDAGASGRADHRHP